MPTNDDTPTIETFMERFAAYCDSSNREIEYDTSNSYEGWDEAKAALQNLIDRARLNEALDALEFAGGMNMAIKSRIKALEAKIKEGE